MLFIYAFIQRDIVFSVLNIFAVFISGYQFAAKLIEDGRKDWKTPIPHYQPFPPPPQEPPAPPHSLVDTHSTRYNHTPNPQSIATYPHSLHLTTCYIH